jgi:hypothetical protein
MAKRKISFWAKVLGIRPYLNEVPVEGKISDKFLRKWDVEVYVRQIIRVGNCITLLSNKFTITEETFWNLNYFKDYVQYVYWTFNETFLEKITEGVNLKSLTVLSRFRDLLLKFPNPYLEPEPEDADDELRYSYLKKRSLANDKKNRFDLMFSLDRQNRQAFLLAVEKRISDLTQSAPISEAPSSGSFPDEVHTTIPTARQEINFLDVLRPMNGKPENTLQLIKEKTEEARLDFNIFTQVRLLKNGDNPYGLNGCMIAMIDHFYTLKYFKNEEYTLAEVFSAYLRYSGNKIGKMSDYLAHYHTDKYYKRNIDRLKSLKIKRLQ